MRVLVTGGAGYLGGVLVPKLLARRHDVRVLDVGYFGFGHLRGTRPPVDIIRKDLRVAVGSPEGLDELLEGIDCVLHLAAISNDPSAELRPELTREVNFLATVALAEAARARGIRFVFSSTCSVYGTAAEAATEDSALAPLTTYASSKVEAEKALAQLTDASWQPVVLRNGTLFGHSGRMRFDLVVNIFSLFSAIHGRIKVFGDGTHWRPYLHIGDCARAFVHFAESPDRAEHMIYNVAHENLRVLDVAETFKELSPGLVVEHTNLDEPDERDYRVSAARLQAAGFEPRVTVRQGAEEMIEAIVAGVVPDPESIFYRNAKWLKELTSFSPGDHGGFMTFVETLARARPPQAR